MSDPTLPSRWRFSIRTLLGWTIILALAITVWMQWRELRPLREEVQRLRHEGGHLAIEDPSLLHAIGVPTPQADDWRWRVHVPRTGRYQLCFQQAKIPAEGLPTEASKRMTFPLEPGEHRLDLVIEYREGELPQHIATLSTHDRQLGMMELFESTENWLDVLSPTVNRLAKVELLGNRTQSFSPSAPAILMRYRAHNVEISDPPTEGRSRKNIMSVSTPSDGLMLWIERVP